MTDNPRNHGAGRPRRRRWPACTAAATAALVTVGAVLSAGGGPAGATPALQARAVGNFLDATLGNQPIDQIAKLQYATATSPGRQSMHNPLDVTALGRLDLPLSGKLQLPKTAGADAGMVNQVAVAHSNGSSYGASGAVANSGGISVGADNNADPDVATIRLCASSLSGAACGGNPADALGEVDLRVGAVAAVASTPKGYGRAGSTRYRIAGLDLTLSSPVLATLIKPVTAQLSDLLQRLGSQAGSALPQGCTLTPDLTFDGGALAVDANGGTIEISLAAALKALGLDLNALPANTDLVQNLLRYLSSANGLAQGLRQIVTGLTDPLENAAKACIPSGAAGDLLRQLTGTIDNGKQQVQATVDQITRSLGGADASALLDPLESSLKKVLDIGVNVQPNGPKGSYSSPLAATPKQGTPVVAYQTIVRAIEIDLIGDPAAAVALANAAAGPGTAAPVASPSSPPAAQSNPHPESVPTGVPAGMGAPPRGRPVLPIVLLALGLLFAAGGVAAVRFRGRFGPS